MAAEGVPYGDVVRLGDARVSFHPAGHVFGSAQVRIEAGGAVWVVSGDYKRAPDPTCAPFEVVACDTFVTEATFALPIYRWGHPERVAREVLAWWDHCAAGRRAAVLYCYALGKAQRILAELARLIPGRDRAVLTHGMVEPLVSIYREAGVPMLPTRPLIDLPKKASIAGDLVLAPILARGTPWTRRFGDHETAFASGFMRLREHRQQRTVDRGFVLSDHADWQALLDTIAATGAHRVLATHGYAQVLARHLREARGLDTGVLETRFEGEADAAAEVA